MKKSSPDSPGVPIPPPLYYASCFMLSILLQVYFPITKAFFFRSGTAIIIGSLIILSALCFSVPALIQFFKSKNTLMTIRPAASLQTNGIYAVSRNPMYTGLMLLYLGLALIFGNWWTLMLLPLLIVLITYRIIRPEERYLNRAFGNSYEMYKGTVRRWI